MYAKQELNLFFITKKLAYILNETTKSDTLDYISNNSKVIVVIIIILMLIIFEIVEFMKPYVLFLIILII